MITIKATSGPHTGQTRVPSSDVDPGDLLRSMHQNGWTWEIDYSQATPEESFQWGRADLVMRCVRAIMNGLPVRFLGKAYADAGELEDAIVAAGRMITLGRDDETGVEVVAGDLEEN